MTILADSRILLFKMETTYGVDPGLAGVNAVLAKNIKLNPMAGEDVSRGLEFPSLAGQPTVPAKLRSTLEFEVELAPSGTAGVPPAWGVMLRACSVAETIVAATSVTYNRISDDQESAAFRMFFGETCYTGLGARGDAEFMVNAQGVPSMKFKFDAIYTPPVEAARVVPDISAYHNPDLATEETTPVFTVDGASFELHSFSFAFGNAVEPRFPIGKRSILITDVNEQLKFRVDAKTLTEFDPYAKALAQAQVPIVLQHGIAPGKIATFNFPRTQLQRPESLEESQKVLEWPLAGVPLPTGAGDDQWTLTLT